MTRALAGPCKGAEFHQYLQFSILYLTLQLHLPLALPAYVAMTLIRPIMISHAYLSLSSCPLTRRVPAVIPPCIPLRTFHHPACFRMPNKPIHTLPRSTTLIPSSMLPASRNDAKGLAHEYYHNLRTDIPALSSSHRTDMPTQLQSHLYSSASSSNGLERQVYLKASQREKWSSDWRWTLHSPQPSGELIVIRSSLVKNLWRAIDALGRETMGQTPWKIIRAFLGIIIVLVIIGNVWETMTGQIGQRKQELCRRCGKKMISEGWYWRDDLPEDTPLQDWKRVCWKCSHRLRDEGHYLQYVGVCEDE